MQGLIMIALQFSMGFSPKAIKLKIPIFVIVSICAYFIIHFIAFENFREIINSFIEMLGMYRYKWW